MLTLRVRTGSPHSDDRSDVRLESFGQILPGTRREGGDDELPQMTERRLAGKRYKRSGPASTFPSVCSSTSLRES